MNERLASLQDYPFTRLRALLADVTPNAELTPIALSLGEPKHAPPQLVVTRLADRALLQTDLATYPATRGSDELRNAIAAWLSTRFGVELSAETHILPVNGTREALFSFAQACLSGNDAHVMMPNPFYQIYEGAALLAGAQPYFVNNDPALGYQQDFASIDAEVWQQTELLYLCSPGNPTGQVMPLEQLKWLVEKAHQYDFVIAADECYAEIYPDDAHPPHSLLNACQALGDDSYQRCVVFHSLSKRSNLPGLRSGFVAGDATLMADYLQYRTYHGCALSAHHQAASALAWQDEEHVVANRALYREKFAAVEDILAPVLPLNQSDGGFYHWIPTPMDDTGFCRQLVATQNVMVLPGQFLARSVDGINPGSNHVRVAWVAPLAECIEAARRIRAFTESLT
ncbi:MAG: succinyldiaminopimelate transaminase [Pseudomonadales bacterium]